MLPLWSSSRQSVLPVFGEERRPRPHIWMAVDRLLRRGLQSTTQDTSATSNPLARASTLISTRIRESGLRYSVSSTSRSSGVVSLVNTAAMIPVSLNFRHRSSQCLIVAPNTMVLRWLANFTHSATTLPTIAMPRSAAAASVHSPPEVAAPLMSVWVQENTRMGTSTPDSVRSCIVVALTRLLNNRPSPTENGVADRPMTAARQFGMYSVQAFSWVCASSITMTSASGQSRRARVCADAI